MNSPESTIMITGSSRGIGRHLAEHYCLRGFRVVGCSRGAVADMPEGYLHFSLSVTDEPAVISMFREVKKTFGRLDALINNAAIYTANHCMLTPIKTVREVFDVNVSATFLLCREAAKLMRTDGNGRIVNVSTVAVRLCDAGTSVYGASKAAVEHLSKVLARELAGFGVTVNVIGYSVVEGEGMAERLSDAAVAATLGRSITGKPVQPVDVAHAMDFFISDRSARITGQTVYLE
jgi:3-oxoacyl-[acyl-carrier protein] reductase